MKRFFSLMMVLALAMICLVTVQAAGGGTYTGDVLLAVSNSLAVDYEDLVIGQFYNVTMPDGSRLEKLGEAGVFDRYVDPYTGETMTVLDRELEEPQVQEAPEEGHPLRNELQDPAEYRAGSTFELTSSADDGLYKVDMACLYVGDHCTVWGSTSDPVAVQLNAAKAQSIGVQFDEYFDKMTAAFGDYWCDPDGDGKVALMCYDLDHQYADNVSPSTYTAGYFWAMDLIDRYGYINDQFYYGDSGYINGIDCVHIDTYPGMGSDGNLMGSIDRCYSTLFHEFQHMINFSWTTQVSGYEPLDSMETYLNEAFAMAAEHAVLGPEATSSRIYYFNNYSSVSGWPLTYWAGQLPNYSNSYLFGQYIRTQYGLKTGTDGVGLFKAVFYERDFSNEDDTLGIIADLLDTEPLTLVQDFWQAVYYKKDTGKHGFAGETWSYSIQPYIWPITTGDYIYSGGAIFYDISATGQYTVNSSSYLDFFGLSTEGVDQGPPLSVVDAYATLEQDGSETFAVFWVQPSKPCSIYFDFVYDGTVITDPGDLRFSDYLDSAGYAAGWGFPYEEGRSHRFYFYLEDSTGQTTEMQCLELGVSQLSVLDTRVESNGDTVAFYVMPSADCTMHYKLVYNDTVITDPAELSYTKVLTGNEWNGKAWTYTPGTTYRFYFYLEDGTGQTTEMQCLEWTTLSVLDTTTERFEDRVLFWVKPSADCVMYYSLVYDDAVITDPAALTDSKTMTGGAWDNIGCDYVPGRAYHFYFYLKDSTGQTTEMQCLEWAEPAAEPTVGAAVTGDELTVTFAGEDVEYVMVGFYDAAGRMIGIRVVAQPVGGQLVVELIDGAVTARAMLLGDAFVPLCLAADVTL